MTRPSLDARFNPEVGAPPASPVFTEAYGLRHYHIVLSVRNAPDDSHTVTYDLDPTYTPSQISSNEPPNFPVNLTSYGNYIVRARLYARDSTLPHRDEGWLARLLLHHYTEKYEGSEIPHAVAAAIQEIERN